MTKSTKKFYAVVKGRKPGIYETWFGPGGAHEQVMSFPGAVYKGFANLLEAREYIAGAPGSRRSGKQAVKGRPGLLPQKAAQQKETPAGSSHEDEVAVYSDGGCINNPGPGGYGTVIIDGEKRTELSGGFRLTTNNRMELLGSIMGLKSLGRKPDKQVKVYTDSRYVVNGISKGWARKWRKNNWMRDAKHRAENVDLWAILLDLCDVYSPEFIWVKGHAGNVENERCDILAGQAALQADLAVDLAYEKGRTALDQPTLF